MTILQLITNIHKVSRMAAKISIKDIVRRCLNKLHNEYQEINEIQMQLFII